MSHHGSVDSRHLTHGQIKSNLNPVLAPYAIATLYNGSMLLVMLIRHYRQSYGDRGWSVRRCLRVGIEG